MLKTKNV